MRAHPLAFEDEQQDDPNRAGQYQRGRCGGAQPAIAGNFFPLNPVGNFHGGCGCGGGVETREFGPGAVEVQPGIFDETERAAEFKAQGRA